MIEFIKKLFGIAQTQEKNPEENEEEKNPKTPISTSLPETLEYLKNEFNSSSDFIKREFEIDGTKAAIINMDGLINKEILATSVINPIRKCSPIVQNNPIEKYNYIRDNILSTADQVEAKTYEEVIKFMTSGSAMLAIDGCNIILAIGIQGFNFRGITEPPNEVMQRESKEGFVEPLRINATMIRRRIRSPKLKFEMMTLGSVTETDIYLCYLSDVSSKFLVDEMKKRLKKIQINGVLAAGYVSEFLEENRNVSLFSSVGVSERPDTVCAKILEGRVAVLVDGTPSVIIAPFLFTEYFQSLDDYTTKPYFATLTRWLKYFSFFLATLLPGFYVATGTFNPELLPNQLIGKISIAVATTPFSLMFEAFLIHLIYEIMREAGLRLPKPLGHAISIVGGLVIGQTAVSSGLIGGPTLMVVALTALASYVIPNIYEPLAILRLAFIFVGGIMGTWGIMLLFSAVLVDICAKTNFGVPYASPISPFNWFGMRDVFIRSGFRTLSKKVNPVQKMPGSKI
ncbi:MAG: spore germination protein [Oscillospiraceae bacterium]|jgi:spore germination protein KA|nr:spore germination protein [Oscillospiraceae bacterium]